MVGHGECVAITGSQRTNLAREGLTQYRNRRRSSTILIISAQTQLSHVDSKTKDPEPKHLSTVRAAIDGSLTPAGRRRPFYLFSSAVQLRADESPDAQASPLVQLVAS